MYVTDRLVFVELHKTGGSHIGKWLAKLAPGEQIGKHNRVPAHLRQRYIVGSVRNPWDWYVSLWGYGCGGQGAVYHKATRGLSLAYVVRQLGTEMGHAGYPIQAMLRQTLSDLQYSPATWQAVYRDADDAGAFREWLHMMMNVRRRLEVGEGYGFSPVSRWAGILTYRYLKLFTSLDARLYGDDTLGTEAGALNALRAHKLVRSIIRTEQLEEDLIEALTSAGYPLTPEQQADVHRGRSEKTNTSKRRDTSFYYDAPTSRLVLERESLIIREHGYVAPTHGDRQ